MLNPAWDDIIFASRDHVFYFSYMQPPQEDEVSSVWSNADEIKRVNGKCHSNTLHLDSDRLKY